MATLEEVFGISVEPVLSYVERTQVDDRFKSALSEHHHIVIYGSSKQGKTALRQKHLADERTTIVRCGPSTTPETIYQAILRDAGVRVETFETTANTVSAGVKAKWGFKAYLPWVAATDVQGEVSGGAQQQKTLQTEFVGYDFADGQAITELLRESDYKKFVVLENFHYLPIDVQRSLAFDLKTFHEVGVRFIILGIWQEANLLLLHNGDLTERITEVPVEPWDSSDFDRVIRCGSDELLVEIPPTACAAFKENAYGNVGMLQEFLKTYCRVNGVSETLETQRRLENGSKVDECFESKLTSQRGRLLRALEGIAGQSRTDGEDPLILPYYLVRVLLTAPVGELLEGVRRSALLEKIRSLHHRDEKDTIRTSDISHLLRRLPAHQQDMQPPLLYYDSNQQRLKIVDTSQFFALSRLDRDELAEEILDPLHTYD